MSKKRASLLRQAAAKLFADEFKKVASEVSAICGSQAGGGEALSTRCDNLCAVLEARPALAPYVAQGFLTLLPHLLARLHTPGGDKEKMVSAAQLGSPQPSVLRLACELVRSGTPREVLDAALDAQAAASLAQLALGAQDATSDGAAEWVGEAATYILLRYIAVTAQGSVVAERLLQDSGAAERTSELIARCAEAPRHAEEGASAEKALLHAARLTRAAVGVVDTATSSAALVRVFLCNERRTQLGALARQSACVRDELLLLLVVLMLRTSSDQSRRVAQANGDSDEKQRRHDDTNVHSLAALLCAPVDKEAATLPVRLARDLLHLSDAVPTADARDVTAESSSSLTRVEARQLCSLHTCCVELRRSQFESTARVACLQRLRDLLFAEPVDDSDDKALARVALLGLVPEAPRTLHSCACDVDEAVGAGACALLARLLVTLRKASDRNGSSNPAASRGGDSGEAAWSRQLQDTLVDELLLLGCVLVVEDAVVDYSTGVVTAALELLCALLRYSPQSHHRVLASHCMGRVIKMVHDIAERDDCIGYVNDAEKAPLLAALMTSLRLLAPGEAGQLVPEYALADIGTIVSRAATQEAVVEASLETLVFLAAVHPLVASMTLDFEFLCEQLTSGAEEDSPPHDKEDAAREAQEDGTATRQDDGEGAATVPTGANAAIVVRSFDMMTAMVRVEPRVVTFEWIETLVQAVRRLPAWNDKTPVDGFAAAVWECLLQTLRVCDDGREYVFDDDIVAHWCASLRQAAQSKVPATLSLAPLLVCVAAFIPHALLDGPIREVAAAVARVTASGADVAQDCTLVRDTCAAVLDLFDALCQPDVAGMTGEQWASVVDCLLVIVARCRDTQGDGSAARLSSPLPHELRERALERLCASGVHTAPVLLDRAYEAWQTEAATQTPTSGDVEAAMPALKNATPLSGLLEVLGAVLRRCREARSAAIVCSKLAALTCDALQRSDAQSDVAALLGAARSMFDVTSVTGEVQHVAKELLFARDAGGIVPGVACFLRRLPCFTSAVDAGVSAATAGSEAKSMAYGLLMDVLLAAQLDEADVAALTPLQTFLVEPTLGDVPRVSGACELLLFLLNFATVRAQLRAAAPSSYAAALQHIACSADAVAAQLRVSLYQSELTG